MWLFLTQVFFFADLLRILQIQPMNYEARAELIAVRAELEDSDGRPAAAAEASSSGTAKPTTSATNNHNHQQHRPRRRSLTRSDSLSSSEHNGGGGCSNNHCYYYDDEEEDNEHKFDIPFQLYEADKRNLRITCDSTKRHWTALQITRPKGATSKD
jgi:hypothetical protein